MLEIYKDEVKDILSPSLEPVSIREDSVINFAFSMIPNRLGIANILYPRSKSGASKKFERKHGTCKPRNLIEIKRS
jgi:hypothetical protein